MLDKSFGRGGNLPPDCHYTLWCRESRIRRPLPRNPARKCAYRSAFRISSVCKARGEIESFKRGPSPISWTTICRGSWAAGILHIPRMSPGPQRRVRTSREQNFWTFSRITFPHLIRSLNYSSSLLSKMEDSLLALFSGYDFFPRYLTIQRELKKCGWWKGIGSNRAGLEAIAESTRADTREYVSTDRRQAIAHTRL